jgi:5-methylcytosine-specific restriction endonuclease McrA
MFDYCTRGLGMSNSSAQRYITAARLAQRFPSVVARIQRNELHLSTLLVLRDHLTEDNAETILDGVRGKTKFEVEELMAGVHPRPDVAAKMRKIPTARTASAVTRAVQQPVEPLSEARYRFEFTGSREFRDAFIHVRDLMRHSNPRDDIERVFSFCVQAGLEKLLGTRLGAKKAAIAAPSRTKRPPRRGTSSISRAIRRAVFERDGERCTYTNKNGRRCIARTLLELDHIRARARDGAHGVKNLRVRCRAHNRLHAEETFGKSYVDARIRSRKRKSGANAKRAPHPS